jgi:hypothetical protein
VLVIKTALSSGVPMVQVRQKEKSKRFNVRHIVSNRRGTSNVEHPPLACTKIPRLKNKTFLYPTLTPAPARQLRKLHLLQATQDHGWRHHPRPAGSPTGCAVRGGLVVFGGISLEEAIIGSVEMLTEGGGVFTGQPPLTCGEIASAVALVVDESDSTAGQVLLLGGLVQRTRPHRRCTW